MDQEELLWREQFEKQESRNNLSQRFILGANNIINNIKTQKKKKKILIQKNTLEPRKKRMTFSHASIQLNKTNKQLETEYVEKENLQAVVDQLTKIVAKLRNQNLFMEQQLNLYKKDENSLRNINRLVLQEAKSVKQRISHYNQQIDDTWCHFIRKSSKNIENQVIQKPPSIKLETQQKKKKPKVTFPQYFIQDQFEENNQDQNKQQFSQSDNGLYSLKTQKIEPQIFQVLTMAVESSIQNYSKYELKSVLSCLYSIHQMPSKTSLLKLSKQQISIYTKEQIINYYQSSYPISGMQDFILDRFKTLREDIRHRQQEYLLLEQLKKELSQKLSVITKEEEEKQQIVIGSNKSMKQLYDSDVNVILLVLVSMERLLNREIGIVSSMLKILNVPEYQFQELRENFRIIQKSYFNDHISNIFRQNFNKVNNSSEQDRLRSIMQTAHQRTQKQQFQIQRVAYLGKFYFRHFLAVYSLIVNAQKQLRLPEKAECILGKNTETYYIQTPDYYRVDNFRIIQKFDKKYRRNIVSTTTRIQRKQTNQTKPETVKTQSYLLIKPDYSQSVERIATGREPRSTMCSDRRNRLQKTYNKVLSLSNIVKKIGCISKPLGSNRFLQTLRLSK